MMCTDRCACGRPAVATGYRGKPGHRTLIDTFCVEHLGSFESWAEETPDIYIEYARR